MKAIETRDLGKVYEDGVLALRELSLSVEQGEIYGFLGPNGAGKSTTVRLLNGALNPSAGEALVLGRAAGAEEVRRRTATMGETARMYESLTVEENLLFFARLYDVTVQDAKRRIAELLERLKLGGKAGARLGTLSTGMRQRVQLARVLLHRPDVLFLDEPTSGLDPESSREVTSLVRELAAEQGTTVFLCTHNLPMADEICDRFGFLHAGRLVRSGSRAELVEASGRTDILLVRTKEGDLRFPLAGDGAANRHLRDVLDQGRTIIEAVRERPRLTDLYFSFIEEATREHVA
jgi:ABC-2 type transport system ATP-binding protein